MKTLRLAILLVALSCSAVHATTLEDADLWKDMHSILDGYHFQLPSDGHWSADGFGQLVQAKIFTGSAVFVVDTPTPSPESYTQLAIRICNGFCKIYDLGTWGSTGDRVIPSGAGEAYLKWANNDDRSKADESITLRVQVVALRNSQIGIFLTLVHVTPRAKPGT